MEEEESETAQVRKRNGRPLRLGNEMGDRLDQERDGSSNVVKQDEVEWFRDGRRQG